MQQGPELWANLWDRYGEKRPRKLLALDGGGIRGLVSLGILESIERTVGKPLCEYFDYIAGTSTGAIVAAGLARGKSVADMRQFYRDFGPAMFEKRFLLTRLKSLYTSDPLRTQLQQVFGADTTLEPQYLKTLLLVVTRNWTTDSAWPISSNPLARYNLPVRDDCNLKIPLWQLVRASTAAPVYFPPEILKWDPADPTKSFVFVDGGVTPYNNPAFLLYRMATLPQYCLNWARGERELLLISVGTGSGPKMGAAVEHPDETIPAQIPGLISALMYGSEVDQDINCRAIGRCVYGGPIDRELLDMIPRAGDECEASGTVEVRLTRAPVPLDQDMGKHFLYARYDAEFSSAGLAKLGFPNANLAQLGRMDLATPDNIERLYAIGQAAGRNVAKQHFGSFLP